MTKQRGRKQTVRSQARAGERQYARTARMLGGAAQPPAAVPRSADADGLDHDIREIPVMLIVPVAGGGAAPPIAQQAADACAYLVRAGEGWYRAAATVWLVPVRQPDPDEPGGEILTMLLSVRARRPWNLPDGTANQAEVQALIADALAAVTAALSDVAPYPSASPDLMPIGPGNARTIVERSAPDARFTTTGSHPSLTAPPAGPRSGESPVALPYRLVDRANQGWRRVTDDAYAADRGEKRGLAENLTLEQLESQRGPLRPVVPADPADVMMVTGALTAAGTKAVGSVLVALFRVSLEYANAADGPSQGVRGTLVAGREGSNETHLMNLLAWEVGSDLSQRAARYDEECVETLIEVLHAWTLRPDVYVEVAATLAHHFGAVADHLGGWDKVADRYLRPGARVGHPPHVIELAQAYLLATAESRAAG